MMFICELYQPINPNLLAYTHIKHNLRIFLTALYIPTTLPRTYVSRVHKNLMDDKICSQLLIFVWVSRLCGRTPDGL